MNKNSTQNKKVIKLHKKRQIMNIALIIDTIDTLESWQLRVAEYIFANSKLNLSLIITNKNTSSEYNFLFSLQKDIERKIFPIKSTLNNNITDTLKEIESADINQDIKSYNLDLIIDLGSNKTDKRVANCSKHGIWMPSFNNQTLNNPKYAGFFDIVYKKSLVSVDLIQIDNSGTFLIERAKFNPNWSFLKTKTSVLEGSVSLIVKNLRLLQNDKIDLQNIDTGLSSYKEPNTADILKYCYNFYLNFFQKVYKRIDAKIFKVRNDCWTLFLGKGEFLESDLSSLKPIPLPKDEFWADPFLCEYGNKTYVFFENYSYTTKLGKISCGEIKENEVVNVVDVLDKSYHLSYPFVYKDETNIYLIPESNENKRLEVYRCVNFPNEWELYSTAFEGERLFDTFIYKDGNNQLWLFTNKQTDENAPVDSELYIYKIDSLKLEQITPHKQNPVLIDSEVARNGGAVFEYQGEIFRPSQCNIDGVYGKYLNINRVKKLTVDEYEEERVKVIKPDFYPHLISMHHLHQTDNAFVIDSAYKRLKQ